MKTKKVSNNKLKLLLGVALFLIVFSLVLYFIFYSGIFNIKNISIISGEPSDDVKLFLDRYLGKNIIVESDIVIKNDIKSKFPEIKEVSVKKKIPDNLVINLEYRQPFYLYCPGSEPENCFLLDDEFVAFSNNIESMYLNLPRVFLKDSPDIKIGDRIFNKPEKIKNIFAFFEDRNIKIEYIKIEGDNIYFKHRNTNFIFNLTEDVDWQIEKLNSFFEGVVGVNDIDNIEYIDLRFGNKVYYK